MKVYKAWFIVIAVTVAHATEYKPDVQERVHGEGLLSKHPYPLLPGPLFSFGQNIVAKGVFVPYINVNGTRGRTRSYNDVTLNILYGHSENLAFGLTMPFITKFCKLGARSSGPGDIFFRGEWAYFNKKTPDLFNQGIIVLGVTAPSGSDRKNPITGIGTSSFFLGTIYYHITPTTYFFADVGGLFPMSNRKLCSRFGRVMVYQSGLGRLLVPFRKGLMFGMLELNGIVRRPDEVHGQLLSDVTGSHRLYLGPSLAIVWDHLVLRMGMQGVVYQRHADPFDHEFWRFTVSLAYVVKF